MLLRNIAKHSSGLLWITKQELWKISLVEAKRTIYLIRESSNLLYDILYGLDVLNDITTCRTIIKQIIAPFIIGIWFNPGAIVSVDDKQNCRALVTALDNLERIFVSIVEAGRPTRLVYHLFITPQLHKKLITSIIASYDADYLTKVRRCLVYSNILQLAFLIIPDEDKTTQPLGFRRFALSFYNIIGHCIQHRHCRDILMITELNSYLWHKLRAYLPTSEIPESWNMCFGDQILVLHLLPVIHAIRQCSERSQYLEEFCTKLLSTSCEQTVRHLYGFREVIMQTNMKGELAIKSVRGLVAMSNYMTHDRANLAFQALIYILNQYVPHIEGSTKSLGCDRKTDLVLYCANLLSIILSGLAIFVTKYNFSWKDCLEAT